jgi:putative DNA methylase
MSAFIETQFPIARLSAESYKERKAGTSQTLTPIGKWWGRKPLILVRASILGMLMPASNNPKKDRDIFLKILTMDDAGVWGRCKGDIPVKELAKIASPELQEEYFSGSGYKRGLSDEEKENAFEAVWEILTSEQQSYLDSTREREL